MTIQKAIEKLEKQVDNLINVLTYLKNLQEVEEINSGGEFKKAKAIIKTVKRRKFSKAGRLAISRGVKAYWAKIKAGKNDGK
jgi:hypothetical protein